jgi:hypothetical protein
MNGVAIFACVLARVFNLGNYWLDVRNGIEQRSWDVEIKYERRTVTGLGITRKLESNSVANVNLY